MRAVRRQNLLMLWASLSRRVSPSLPRANRMCLSEIRPWTRKKMHPHRRLSQADLDIRDGFALHRCSLPRLPLKKLMVEKLAAFAPTVGDSGCGKESEAFFSVNSYWQPLMEANDKARDGS